MALVHVKDWLSGRAQAHNSSRLSLWRKVHPRNFGLDLGAATVVIMGRAARSGAAILVQHQDRLLCCCEKRGREPISQEAFAMEETREADFGLAGIAFLAKACWPSRCNPSRYRSVVRRFQIALIALLLAIWVSCVVAGMISTISRMRSSSFNNFSESKSQGSGSLLAGLNFMFWEAALWSPRCRLQCFRWNSMMAQPAL
jgi:hypothetical protein